MEEVASSLCLDWWIGATKMEEHFQFFASNTDLQPLGGNWLVGGPTASDMAGLLTRKNGYAIAKCPEPWVYLPPEAK